MIIIIRSFISFLAFTSDVTLELQSNIRQRNKWP